jgi:alpha-ketoglutarate-dependent 2,4-dichlorophenoxyacetate dioxygenase
MKISPVTPNFAAVIERAGSEPLVDQSCADTVVDALNRFGVAAIRAAGFSPGELSAFARLFGDIADLPIPGKVDDTFVMTNVQADGRLWDEDSPSRRGLLANELWHSDNTFAKVRVLYSMLQGEVIPPGGAHTEFADMRAAYAELPDDLKTRVESLQARHALMGSRKMAGIDDWTEDKLPGFEGSMIRPLVQTHPLTGEKCLCLASHISNVVGVPEDEGTSLLDTLRDFATDRRFVYQHHWAVGDLLIWDNVATMHRVTPFEDLRYPRRVRSIRVLDPVELAASQ